TYTGREWDSTLHLHHFRARMMDPQLGRFCGRDPIGYALITRNLRRVFTNVVQSYQYIHGRPLRAVDPSGMQGNDVDISDKLRELIEKAKELLKGIIGGPPDLTERPALPIGADDIIGLAGDQLGAALDFLFELDEPGSPCSIWLRSTMRCTLCAWANCNNACCSKIQPSDPYHYPAGPYGDCVDGIVRDITTPSRFDSQRKFWELAAGPTRILGWIGRMGRVAPRADFGNDFLDIDQSFRSSTARRQILCTKQSKTSSRSNYTSKSSKIHDLPSIDATC
ncbi:MAG: hypothetical protein D6698_05590, partial [Gammaproteobacteria bacterium]